MSNRDGGDSSARLALGVVTYNNPPVQLEHLLKSVELAAGGLKADGINVTVYSIDNGEKSVWPSSDIPFVTLEPVGNVGFGRAMNLLMESAFRRDVADWFLCVNPDGVLHRECLQHLLASSAAHPNSLVEARQFPEEHAKEYNPHTLETPWATGACLLIPKRIYLALGGFDPNFFMYFEDIDYSWRARSSGFSVRVAPKARFAHLVLDRPPNPQLELLFLTSGRYLAYKWGNAKFVAWCEEQLVKRGFYQSAEDLPRLQVFDDNVGQVNSDLGVFHRGLHFARPRW